MLKDCKKKDTNLAMTEIDYRNVYHLAPSSWICECLEIYGLQKIVYFVGESLGRLDIRKGIFRSDSLYLLLFVPCMVPLTLIFRKVKAAYK